MKWLPLIFLTLAFAGCTDDPALAEPSDDPDDPNFQPNEMPAPTWNVGDIWEFQSSGGVLKLVVTSDDGADYILDTNNTNIAFFEDQFDISYVGPMSKADLAGRQGNTAVQYFDFPLHDAKEWTTTWDGEQMRLIAHDNGDNTFHIGAYVGDVMVNEYQYSNITKFWDWISFGDAEGNEQFRMDLISYGTGHTGQLIRINSELVQDYDGSVGGPAASSIGYTIAAVEGDLLLNLNFACTSGAYLAAVGPVESVASIVTADPESDGMSSDGTCPLDATFNGVIGSTPTEGTWGHAFVGLDSLSGKLWHRQYEYVNL